MPTEVPHTPTKLFYKQELFLSTVDGTHPIVAIVGKCAVLDYGEYICSKYVRCLTSVRVKLIGNFNCKCKSLCVKKSNMDTKINYESICRY